jgi:hypothetical protein
MLALNCQDFSAFGRCGVVLAVGVFALVRGRRQSLAVRPRRAGPKVRP